MKDSQKKSMNYSSGGQRIDDHAFFAGSGSPKLPMGVHNKEYNSAEGSASLTKYEDTTEAIKEMQVDSVKKVKGHPMKLPNRY